MRKINNRLQKLIEINCNLAGDLSNPNKSNKKDIAMVGLAVALKAISTGTQYESEIDSIIDQCERFM